MARSGVALDRPQVRVLPQGHLIDLESAESQSLAVRRLLSEEEVLGQLEPPAALPSEPLASEPLEEHAHEHEHERVDSPAGAHDDSDDCRLC